MIKQEKRIIITGPTGAIGIALIKCLLKESYKITAICRKNSIRVHNIPASSLIDVVECDLKDICSLEGVLKGSYDIFYHLGWDGTFGDSRDNLDVQMKNIQYTLEAVKLAKKLGCSTFIGAGSQAEYGRYEGTLNALTPAFPENGYGMAKLCAGQMSRVLCEQLGIKHIWVRVLSVYGPYDGSNTMVMSTIMKLLTKQSTSFTKGEQLWDYLYSDDAAQAFRLLGEYGKHGKIYCLGSGKAKPLKEYICTIGRLIDSNVKLGIGELPYSNKQVMHLCADISELQTDTGFQPRVDFEEGIKSTILWCRGLQYDEEN